MKSVPVDEAIAKRFPEGVALIICQDSSGKVNLTPIGWFTLCNSEPHCWAICLYKKHFSHEVISKTKEYVLCLPSFAQKKEILYLGSVHGWETDKLKKTKLQTLPSSKVTPPLIKDSIACFECKVIKTFDVGDHSIFVGQILASYVSKRTDKTYNLGSRNLIKCDLEWKLRD